MAAASTLIMAGGAIMGAATSGALAIGGNSRKKKAESELRNLVPPELRNYYSDVPVSTMGSRIASQNMAQNNSNMINAAQRGGIRALSSLAPTLTEANIQQNQAIAQDIDTQYRQNKINEAQGGMQVQNMVEDRYKNTLAGLQQERAAGLQDTYTGLSNLSQSVMAIGSVIPNEDGETKQPPKGISITNAGSGLNGNMNTTGGVGIGSNQKAPSLSSNYNFYNAPEVRPIQQPQNSLMDFMSFRDMGMIKRGGKI